MERWKGGPLVCNELKVVAEEPGEEVRFSGAELELRQEAHHGGP